MSEYGRHFLPLLLAPISLWVVFFAQPAHAVAGSVTVAASKPYIRPYESVRITAQSVTPLTLPAQWFINGEVVAGSNGYELMYSFSRNGQWRVSVVLADGSSAYTDILVISNPFIKLAELVPNPQGSDTNAETLTLENTGDEEADVKGWELRSRTSTTKIDIEGSVPSGGRLEIILSSKLRNSGGTYDLFNESNEFVDTVTYPAVKEGEKVRRESLMWTVDEVDTPLTDSAVRTPKADPPPATFEKAHAVGTVTLPQGRTLDISTSENEPVHVVVHASYTVPRPRLHKGDLIEVTGTWRRSRSGPYISVREGDIFQLVSKAPEPVVRRTSASNAPRRLKSPVSTSASPVAFPVSPVTAAPLSEASDVAADTLSMEKRVSPPQPQWSVLPYSASVVSVWAGILILFYPRKTV